jgi:hypothetical protein
MNYEDRRPTPAQQKVHTEDIDQFQQVVVEVVLGRLNCKTKIFPDLFTGLVYQYRQTRSVDITSRNSKSSN